MAELNITIDEVLQISIERKGRVYELSISKREQYIKHELMGGGSGYTKWETEAIIKTDAETLLETLQSLREFIHGQEGPTEPKHKCLPECTDTMHFEI
jgi:hypothetical protein